MPFARVREIHLANPTAITGDSHAPLVTDDLGVTLRAHAVSAGAREKIEKAGGTVELLEG